SQAAYDTAMARLAADVSPPRIDGASLSQVDAALNRLVMCAPGVKRRIVDACAHCVAADGMIRIEEGEMLRLVTAMLDCPLPPFLANVVPSPAPAPACA